MRLPLRSRRGSQPKSRLIQKNVTAEQMEEGAGDCWTWTAIDADTKLIISYMLGDRGATTAQAFMRDVASRISTSGHWPNCALYFLRKNRTREWTKT